MRKEIYKKDAEKLLEDALNPNIKEVVKYSSLYREDGWKNALTGLGTKLDKSSYTYFQGIEYLDWDLLTHIWIGDGLGSKIVKSVAEDMTREWITIKNDSEEKLLNKINDIGGEEAFELALTWDRLFGGSIIVVGVDDGRLLEEPVIPENIKSVDYFQVYDRTDVTITNFNFFEDPSSKDFGKVEFYTVSSKFGPIFNVHRDRVLEFKGIPVPNRAKDDVFWYWGMSELQRVWKELKDFGAGKGHALNLLYEFVIGVYKLENLADLIAEGNEQKLRNRMRAIETSKSTLQGVLLDSEEDYRRDSANIAGIPDLLDRLMMFVSGVTGIPVTRLFGRSPAGQNSTGESDLRNYYDMIKPEQRRLMRRPLNKLIGYVNASEEMKNYKVEDPSAEFKPLYQLSEKEVVEMRERQSKTDVAYLDKGVLDPEEVRESRFSNGYSFETSLMEPEEIGEIDVPTKTEEVTEEKEEGE